VNYVIFGCHCFRNRNLCVRRKLSELFIIIFESESDVVDWYTVSEIRTSSAIEMVYTASVQTVSHDNISSCSKWWVTLKYIAKMCRIFIAVVNTISRLSAWVKNLAWVGWHNFGKRVGNRLPLLCSWKSDLKSSTEIWLQSHFCQLVNGNHTMPHILNILPFNFDPN
jgi:hypothetical protein